jgi:membrane protein YqaA with SNARE-associated domain
MQLPDEEPFVDEAVSLGARQKLRLAWRLEYIALSLAVVLVILFAFTFFYFDVDITRLQTYGYIGVFAISLIGAASIVLPTPSVAAILGGGTVLNPLLGLPPFLLVGLVAGFGEALGEFTGYALGFGGGPAVRERAFYQTLERWMIRHGMLTMFIFSAIPNPVFDVVGVAAGAVRMPLWRFFFSVLAGKILKDIALAGGGVLGIGLIEKLLE